VASLCIDRMRRPDLDEVLLIERASFSLPWSRGAFVYEMEQNQVARCLVVREEERVLGYICLWEVADELHVTNIAVHPAARRRGLARAMLAQVMDEARRRSTRIVVLEVRPSNVEARALYDSLGFRVVGRRRGYYYDTGEDALVMEATLDASQDRGQAAGGNRR
jgi:ribosomal-protein-alanine N-acetyltransferase